MKQIDLTGRKFGRLVVIARAENTKSGEPRWLCRCDCGREKAVQAGNLRSGHTTSCGCWKHGLTKTPAYSSWTAMISRCTSETNPNYRSYGGRGVKVCERWRHSFLAFLEDMGERPSVGHSIDRYPDGKGNYEPGNCRWATRSQQRVNQDNSRRGKLIEFRGKRMSVKRWANEIGIARQTLVYRLRTGWPVEVALTKGISHGRSRAGKASAKARRAKSFSQ